MKVKLLKNCLGPSIFGKKGDVVEIHPRHLCSLVEPVKDEAPEPKKKAAKKK